MNNKNKHANVIAPMQASDIFLPMIISLLEEAIVDHNR